MACTAPRVATVDVSASVLALEPGVLRRVVLDGNVTRYPESHYLDFVIDGRSLTEQIACARGLATTLNRAWLATVNDAVGELRGTRSTDGLSPGRVALYVCGDCGDLGCGAVTAKLHVGADTVSWAEFAWENGYEPSDPIKDSPTVIHFSAPNYADVLATADERVAALPYDELAHHGRAFLWPWQWGWRLPKDR